MMKLFDNKVVVITGATSGIGAATAKLFAQEGAEVILVGRNAEKGNKLVYDIHTDGGKAAFIRCDVSKEDDVRHLALELNEKYQRVDVLFNNAGIMPPSTEIEKMPVDDWKKTFEINIDGMFYVTRYLKKLIFSCKGTIINNASIAGMHSYVTGRSYAYSASKAAVIQFSRQMAKNYAEEGIRVNCICPGIIDTPILGDRDRKKYAKRIPLGYVGQPEDVANVIAFLASDKASYLTGVVLPVDGGGGLSCP
jgi:meso-butanediol dehydrogenase/(S,S)-butanediol dehydrogenase/diacetyl reductase